MQPGQTDSAAAPWKRGRRERVGGVGGSDGGGGDSDDDGKGGDDSDDDDGSGVGVGSHGDGDDDGSGGNSGNDGDRRPVQRASADMDGDDKDDDESDASDNHASSDDDERHSDRDSAGALANRHSMDDGARAAARAQRGATERDRVDDRAALPATSTGGGFYLRPPSGADHDRPDNDAGRARDERAASIGSHSPLAVESSLLAAPRPQPTSSWPARGASLPNSASSSRMHTVFATPAGDQGARASAAGDAGHGAGATGDAVDAASSSSAATFLDAWAGAGSTFYRTLPESTVREQWRAVRADLVRDYKRRARDRQRHVGAR